MPSEADGKPGRWLVRDGVLEMTFHRTDYFKILSLTDAKLEIQDMYHGRHKGTWTRASSAEATPPNKPSPEQPVPGGVTTAAASKQITKISGKVFDIPKEVVAFVSHLVEANDEVRAQYEELCAEAHEEAGGRFSAGDFVAIEWLVPNFEVEFRERGRRDGEYVFLVLQQLHRGFHRGYAVKDNVVARVDVKLHEDHEQDPNKSGDFRLVSNTIGLTFDGFFDLKLVPVANENENEGSSTTSSHSTASVAPHTLGTVFNRGPYATYNAYTRRHILRRAQGQLREAGFYHGGIDGAMGPGTQAAIIAWQENKGIPATGLLDDQTLQSMSLLGLAEQSPPRRRVYQGQPVREYNPGPDAAEVIRRTFPWTP